MTPVHGLDITTEDGQPVAVVSWPDDDEPLLEHARRALAALGAPTGRYYLSSGEGPATPDHLDYVDEEPPDRPERAPLYPDDTVAPAPAEPPADGPDSEVREGDQLLVRDLGDQHIGWMIEVRTHPHSPTAPTRTFVLVAIRRWTYEGVERAGLLDDDRRGPFIGTEHSATGDMPVTVLRRIKTPRRSRARRPSATNGATR